MATSQSHAIKCLNKSSGRRRFVFKSFSQRVEEIEIDVFRSLDPVKSEPSIGSSFLLESLLHWKELNTAEDFISFYEEMMPIVQTLPQILLHKDKIFSELLQRVRMEAKLSIEPILRLFAALSRDILEDFLLFLPRLADSLVDLLKHGGERDPEILEQVFTSWSYIMMYLQKYLVKDVVLILKITVHLRYYPKDYVQEFMAEAVSFLLRKAPDIQVRKGIRKVIYEVLKNTSPVRKNGVSALLWNVLRGTSSRLHSRAELVLRLLIGKFILNTGDKFPQGSDVVVEVVTSVFQRLLCEELVHKELSRVWDLLLMEISGCLGDGCLLHMSHLLAILIYIVQFSSGSKICDYGPIIEHVRLLIQTYIKPPDGNKSEGHFSEVLNKVLQLMLCLLDVPAIHDDFSILSSISLHWAPVFDLKNSSLLQFIEGLLLKDPQIQNVFRTHIISAMDDLIESSPEEVLYLMLKFFEGQGELQFSEGFDGVSDVKSSRICCFFKETLCYWLKLINDIALEMNSANKQFHESEVAVLWGVLSCYPHVHPPHGNPSLMDLIGALNQLLAIESDSIAGLSKSIWQSVVGAALASYHKVLLGRKNALSETRNFLHIAKVNKSSPQVLCAVADFLDFVFGPTNEADDISKFPELDVEQAVDAVSMFANNLALPSKTIRVSTLRILSHYAPLDRQLYTGDEHPCKKLKTEGDGPCNEDSKCSNDIQLLLSIESSPLSIATSRKIIGLISRLQMGLSAEKKSNASIPLLINGIIGIFHNRFSHLWKPAVECLTVLVGKYKGLVWDRFFQYLESCQSEFLSSIPQVVTSNIISPKSNALGDCFNLFVAHTSESTPCATVLGLLLQTLQKTPAIAESRSRQLVPLFLKFVGYADDNILSVEAFNCHTCNGKEWRLVLKEWLNLLSLLHNSRSLYRNQFLKEVLMIRFLDEMDTDIQLKVLDCLLNWRDDFLLPYAQHLRTLTISKKMREELTTWTISKESSDIQEGHRRCLIPLAILMLTSKVRKLRTLAARKHAGVNHRRAVLCFLAQLDANELPLFFALLLKPLLSNAPGIKVLDNEVLISLEDLAKCSNSIEIANLSWKKRCGFLHVVEDTLRSFDELRIQPFLNLLMMIVVRMLESCTLSVSSTEDMELCTIGENSNSPSKVHETNTVVPNTHMINTSAKQFKDLRSICLRIISSVLYKYECHDFSVEFWDIFFSSIKPLVGSFKQEGSSSEKPSSLFSCFVAMSRSSTFVSLLSREANLVPTIFSILTVKTASEAIISSVLSFVENILNLDNELVHQEDNSIKGVFMPHLETLILSLNGLFQRHKETKRKSTVSPGKREIKIFRLLARYVNEPLGARQFVEIVLSFFRKRALNADECVEGLHVIKGMLPVLDDETTGEVLNAIHPLLISAELDMRLCICDILDGLAIHDHSLAFLAKLLRDLNAISASELSELDYDTRVNAYETIKPELFSVLSESHALVILSQCVYDMSSEDLILRQSASKSLLSFIQFAASILDCEAKNCTKVLPPNLTLKDTINSPVQTVNANSWTKSCIQQIIRNFFLRYMGEAVNKEISVQKEWIALLREMVIHLAGVSTVNSLRPLWSKDAEVDFFNNILHLQIHRRAKALARFRNVVGDGKLSEVFIVKLFVPLFFNMMFEVKDGKGEHLRNACMESLASISGQMRWETYHAFLMRCFREMTLKPDKQKILLRLICCVLDMFHFSDIEPEPSNMRKDHGQEVSDSGIIERIPRIASLSSSSKFYVPAEIQDCLQKKILPKIGKLLTSDSERVNVNISVAALKLLKLLPVDSMESQLPSIIHRISNFLKNRLESVRAEARSALVACAKELGLEYLKFIVDVLRATLKRGYELHVLGYTLNFILSNTLTQPIIGRLDYCLEELLAVLENDILGDVAEEKEVDKIASKMKETRKCKSFDTLTLISQGITFRTHALKLLSPIKTHLQKHVTAKEKAKLEKMLHHIALGIECNPSADQKELFIFVYGLIEDGVVVKNLQSMESSMTRSNHELATKISTLCNSNYGLQNSHLITGFALGVLNNRLKNIKLDKKDENLLSMLDPFVNLLGNCLNSKYEDIVSAAFRCLAPLIRLPLPSLEFQADKIKILLLDIAQKSGNPNSQLVQSCFKLLTVLLQSTRISLSNDQLRMLIQFPLFIDLQTNPSTVALSCLKAIVARKLVIHEVYDVAVKVAELMVTSQLEPIRKKCSQILLQFLLDYKLSTERLQQHLDFLLTNLSYEHSSGREAVLEMLHAILVKFPRSFVDNQAQTLFLHLVVALANDQDTKVQSMVATVIKLLIDRASQHARQTILDYSYSWYQSKKQNLCGAAAQTLGLLVEVSKEEFHRRIDSILQVTEGIMESSINVVADKELDLSNDAAIPFWKEGYYSLALLEKMLLQFPNLYLDKNHKQLWEAICRFLLHPHIWLRNISSGLVALYFTAASEAGRVDPGKLSQGSLFLMNPSRLFLIAASFCNQLMMQPIDDDASNVITQNLVFSICGVHSFARQRKSSTLHGFWSTLDPSEQSCYLEAFKLLGSRKGRDAFLLKTSNYAIQTSEARDQIDQNSCEDLQSLLVARLLKRMGKIAFVREDIQMKVVFNCFRMISLQIGSEGCHDYAFHMLLPLYKVCEGFSGKVISDEVKQLAEEVRKSIREVLGVDHFVQTYNLIRKSLREKRNKRKQEEKLIAVINPMRHAKRKLKIASKHKVHKKRKIMALKMERWRR